MILFIQTIMLLLALWFIIQGVEWKQNQKRLRSLQILAFYDVMVRYAQAGHTHGGRIVTGSIVALLDVRGAKYHTDVHEIVKRAIPKSRVDNVCEAEVLNA